MIPEENLQRFDAGQGNAEMTNASLEKFHGITLDKFTGEEQRILVDAHTFGSANAIMQLIMRGRESLNIPVQKDNIDI